MLFLSSTIVRESESYCGAPTVTSCHSIPPGRKRQGQWRGAGAGQKPDNTSASSIHHFLTNQTLDRKTKGSYPVKVKVEKLEKAQK